MNQQTHVKSVKVKPAAERLKKPSAGVTELPPRKIGMGARFFQIDTLVRNMAVVGGLVLVLVAVRNSASPEVQSVFNAIQEGTGMKWDESVGKLSFVNAVLPKEIREVWSETWPVEMSVPTDGAFVQAWSNNNRYVLIGSLDGVVSAAADGEVMSVAHGLDEERILRIRHDGFETVYGNLISCSVETGDLVYAGQKIGMLFEDQPLSFEVRIAGRSVDPEPYFP